MLRREVSKAVLGKLRGQLHTLEAACQPGRGSESSHGGRCCARGGECSLSAASLRSGDAHEDTPCRGLWLGQSARPSVAQPMGGIT
jgi:hypothetical protein